MSLNDPDLLRALDDQAKALEAVARATREARTLIAADASPERVLVSIASMAAAMVQVQHASAVVSNIGELMIADLRATRGGP